MLKIKIVILISHLLVIQAFSQIFRGKLIYKVIFEDSVNLKERLRFAPILEQISFRKNCTVWIKNDSLKFYTTADSGKPNSIGFQFNDRAYLKKNVKEKTPYDTKTLGKSLIYDGKGKKQLTILGKICKEYNFASPVNQIIEKVWIPDNFKFKDEYNYGKFFLDYFYPQGLAFRIQTYYNGILQTTWELIEIQNYDVPSDEFDECEILIKN
jgi:hypothetical protein